MQFMKKFCSLVLMVLLVNVLAYGQAVATSSQVRYQVKDLGTLGGTYGNAQGINNKGWIDGYANLKGDTRQHAFLRIDELMIDLGTLGGPNSQSFLGPNKRGQVAGLAETRRPDPNNKDFCFFGTGLICRAFLWENGRITDLGTLGGNNSSAFDINNRGQAVGGAENTARDPTCTTPQYQFRAVIWEDGKIHELPALAEDADPDTAAFAVNDSGQVVGASCDCTTQHHALLWQNGTAVDLGTLGGHMNNAAIDNNSLGEVVGFSDVAGDTTRHGFLWQNGRMTDLGTLDFASAAFGINREGQVVGWSCDASFASCRAFLWQDGAMTDLNTLIPSNSPLYLTWADDINSSGQIVGLAIQKSTGQPHAFLATPCKQDGGEAQACEDGGEAPAARSESNLNIVMPENVRQLIQQRIGMGRLEGGLIMPH
jgi:probable HAF family extracellular repeat protein